MELKKQLIELKAMAKEQIFNLDMDDLIHKMLVNIGTVDPELRDALIYATFIRLIDDDFLTGRQLQAVMETCLDHNHLFYRIGETNSDSVFTRSFSSLIIAAVLEKDKKGSLLPAPLVAKATASGHSYLRQERDTRGYVEGKGWAHSIAHGADLLVAAINHPHYRPEQSKAFLDTVRHCLFKDAAVYTDDEDERLIFVIESLIDKGLEETEFVDWILKVFDDLEMLFEEEGHALTFYRKKRNVTNFFKSLYFRLGYKNRGDQVRRCIKENLKIWHQRLFIL
ncbi:DUF2785 domain-containing protein [Caenibacillus caldisaponilyticus]|uniref:DUF2785 domain-containing protein n=1 Tax=Caenibacillus caldisaponilyticus TaxID=1674942 RepID=UPI00130111C3|nr:DUF2785 domain-containing protein [Caenibacillus caldisaponilyticus]